MDNAVSSWVSLISARAMACVWCRAAAFSLPDADAARCPREGLVLGPTLPSWATVAKGPQTARQTVL